MKLLLLVLLFAIIGCGICDGSANRKFDFGDVQPHLGVISDENYRDYSRHHTSPYYGGHNYGRGSPVVYRAYHPKPPPRPHRQLIPPNYVTPAVPVYPLNALHHPSSTRSTQIYHSTSVTPFRMKGHPRYSLSPVRQYVPHHFPLYSPAVALPPKMVQMYSGIYSTVPYAGLTPTGYHSQSWKGKENNFDNAEVDYYSHHEESDSDDDSDDDSNDDSDDFSIDRKDEVEAEERRDGPGAVNALVGTYDAGQEHKADEHYSKKTGESYGDEHKSKKGYKTSQGHSSEHKFDKGDKGHHSKEVHTKEYDEEGKKKKSHHDEKSKHGSHHEQDHGEKKGEFSEKKKHRKGSKTKGYHNVFHKDEYVKDHTFYDDLDQSGHYKKYEEEHKGHKKESAQQKKGAHHDSAKKQVDEGHHGKYSKGHHDDADSGYDKKHGNEEHYKKEQDYKKKGGEAKKHEFDYLKGY